MKTYVKCRPAPLDGEMDTPRRYLLSAFPGLGLSFTLMAWGHGGRDGRAVYELRVPDGPGAEAALEEAAACVASRFGGKPISLGKALSHVREISGNEAWEATGQLATFYHDDANGLIRPESKA